MIVPLKGFGHTAVMHCDIIGTLILTVGSIITEKPYVFFKTLNMYPVDRRTSSNKQNKAKQAEGPFGFLSGAQWAITKKEYSC